MTTTPESRAARLDRINAIRREHLPRIEQALSACSEIHDRLYLRDLTPAELVTFQRFTARLASAVAQLSDAVHDEAFGDAVADLGLDHALAASADTTSLSFSAPSAESLAPAGEALAGAPRDLQPQDAHRDPSLNGDTDRRPHQST